jgi:hypothetical protein
MHYAIEFFCLTANRFVDALSCDANRFDTAEYAEGFCAELAVERRRMRAEFRIVLRNAPRESVFNVGSRFGLRALIAGRGSKPSALDWREFRELYGAHAEKTAAIFERGFDSGFTKDWERLW